MPPTLQIWNCRRVWPDVHAERVDAAARPAASPINRCTHSADDARHFKQRDHQRDDRDIFDEVGVRADRAAQLAAVVVAEQDAGRLAAAARPARPSTA